jgi:uncharacterized coiled-coil DUF342 family protein
MGREKLEERLDAMFAEQLTSPAFLEGCIEQMGRRRQQDDSAVRIQRLTSEVNSLREKRGRILEAFFDGSIGREEHKSRLQAIDRDIRSAQDLLTRLNPASSADLESLVQTFAPLMEWPYWTRDQKRSVLAALAPDIRVADYRVAALGISPAVFSNENTRRDKDSLPRPA